MNCCSNFSLADLARIKVEIENNIRESVDKLTNACNLQAVNFDLLKENIEKFNKQLAEVDEIIAAARPKEIVGLERTLLYERTLTSSFASYATHSTSVKVKDIKQYDMVVFSVESTVTQGGGSWLITATANPNANTPNIFICGYRGQSIFKKIGKNIYEQMYQTVNPVVPDLVDAGASSNSFYPVARWVTFTDAGWADDSVIRFTPTTSQGGTKTVSIYGYNWIKE